MHISLREMQDSKETWVMSIKFKDLVAHIAWLSKEAPACSFTRLSHYHESLKSQQDNLDLPFDSLQSFFFSFFILWFSQSENSEKDDYTTIFTTWLMKF